MAAKTHEVFAQEFNDLVGDEYTLLSDYINSRTAITVRHNTCGHEYEVRASKFTEGSRCPNCSKSKKLTHKDFIKKV